MQERERKKTRIPLLEEISTTSFYYFFSFFLLFVYPLPFSVFFHKIFGWEAANKRNWCWTFFPEGKVFFLCCLSQPIFLTLFEIFLEGL